MKITFLTRGRGQPLCLEWQSGGLRDGKSRRFRRDFFPA